MLWPRCCECQVSSRGGPVQESFRNRWAGSTVSASTPLWRAAITQRRMFVPEGTPWRLARGDCDSSVARPPAASAVSFGIPHGPGFATAATSVAFSPRTASSAGAARRGRSACSPGRADQSALDASRSRGWATWEENQSAPHHRIHDFVVEEESGEPPMTARTDDSSEWWAVLGSNQWPLPCETVKRG